MADKQHIYIKNNGTRTLYTAGKYLDTDILIDVDVAQGLLSGSVDIDGLRFDSYDALLGYMKANGLTSYTIEVNESSDTLLEA